MLSPQELIEVYAYNNNILEKAILTKNKIAKEWDTVTKKAIKLKKEQKAGVKINEKELTKYCEKIVTCYLELQKINQRIESIDMAIELKVKFRD